MQFSINNSLMHRLHRASQVTSERLSTELGDTRLTSRQLVVLASIAADEGASQTAIGAATGIDRSTMSDVIRRLTKHGLVARKRTREDARTYAIKLTEEGSRVLQAARPVMERVEADMLAAISPKERADLITLLGSLIEQGGQPQPGVPAPRRS